MKAFSLSIITRKMTKSISQFLLGLQQQDCPTFNYHLKQIGSNLTSRSVVHAFLIKYPLASKIMIGNLTYSASESSLLKEFSKFGKIAEVKLVKDEKTNRSKGFAFYPIYFPTRWLSCSGQHGSQKYFDGRIIFIDLAKQRTDEFGGYPRTSGPPEEQHLSAEDQDEN